MADKPASPFASLGTDKALLRSTRPRAEAIPLPAAVETTTPVMEQLTRVPDAPVKAPPPRETPSASKNPRRKDAGESSNRDTMVSRYHGETVETIRRAVRVV